MFRSVMKRYNLAPGDFPDINDFRSKLAEQDFTKFPALRPKLIEELEAVLGVDIPRLMEALPRSLDSYSNTSDIQANPALVYDDIKLSWGEEPGNPFGESAAVSNEIWGLEEYVSKYQDKFNEFQRNGAVAGAAARTVLKRPNVDVASLRKIWELSDIDKDGQLDLKEFVIAMFLADMASEGHPVPDALDPLMIPPGKSV